MKKGDEFQASDLDEAQRRIYGLGVFSNAQVAAGAPDPRRRHRPDHRECRRGPLPYLPGGGGSRHRHRAPGSACHRRLHQPRFPRRAAAPGLRQPRRPRVACPGSSTPSNPAVPAFTSTLKLTQPEIFSYNTDLVPSLQVERDAELGFGYWAFQGRVGLPWKISPSLTLTPAYSAELLLFDSGTAFSGIDLSPTALLSLSCQVCVLSYLEQTLVWDRRNDQTEPSSGFFAQLDIQEAGGPLGGNFSNTRWLPEVRAYFPLGQAGRARRSPAARGAFHLRRHHLANRAALLPRRDRQRARLWRPAALAHGAGQYLRTDRQPQESGGPEDSFAALPGPEPGGRHPRHPGRRQRHGRGKRRVAPHRSRTSSTWWPSSTAARSPVSRSHSTFRPRAWRSRPDSGSAIITPIGALRADFAYRATDPIRPYRWRKAPSPSQGYGLPEHRGRCASTPAPGPSSRPPAGSTTPSRAPARATSCGALRSTSPSASPSKEEGAASSATASRTWTVAPASAGDPRPRSHPTLPILTGCQCLSRPAGGAHPRRNRPLGHRYGYGGPGGGLSGAGLGWGSGIVHRVLALVNAGFLGRIEVGTARVFPDGTAIVDRRRGSSTPRDTPSSRSIARRPMPTSGGCSTASCTSPSRPRAGSRPRSPSTRAGDSTSPRAFLPRHPQPPSPPGSRGRGFGVVIDDYLGTAQRGSLDDRSTPSPWRNPRRQGLRALRTHAGRGGHRPTRADGENFADRSQGKSPSHGRMTLVGPSSPRPPRQASATLRFRLQSSSISTSCRASSTQTIWSSVRARFPLARPTETARERGLADRPPRSRDGELDSFALRPLEGPGEIEATGSLDLASGNGDARVSGQQVDARALFGSLPVSDVSFDLAGAFSDSSGRHAPPRLISRWTPGAGMASSSAPAGWTPRPAERRSGSRTSTWPCPGPA